MSYLSTLTCAVRLACLIAFPSLTSLHVLGESNSRESEQLARTNLLLYRDSKGAVRPVKSLRDWPKRRAEIVRSMEAVMGPLPGKDKCCPLEPKVEEEVDCGHYVRRLLTYAAAPGAR